MLDNGVGEAGLGCMGWAGLGWAGLGQDQVYDKEEFSLPDNNGILPQPSSSVQEPASQKTLSSCLTLLRGSLSSSAFITETRAAFRWHCMYLHMYQHEPVSSKINIYYA